MRGGPEPSVGDADPDLDRPAAQDTLTPRAGTQRRYSRGEVVADAAVHALGATFGVAACGILAAATLPRVGTDPLRALALWVYAAGLVAMLGRSTASAPRSTWRPGCPTTSPRGTP